MRQQNHTAVWPLMGALAISCLGPGCQESSSNDRSSTGQNAAGENPAESSASKKSAKPTSQANAGAVAKSGAKANSKSIEDENVKPAAHTVVVTDAPSAWQDDTPAAMPRVVMSEGHAATCLVKVGQTLPDVALADLEGREQQLSKLMGDRLTVVVLWSNSSIHAWGELNDLAVEVASPLAGRGVRVVGISIAGISEPNGEQSGVEQTKETAKSAGVSFPILLDPDGKFFSQLATERLPRTYLLDGAGKILWLDIEYSRTTHRDLMQAIRFALGGP